MQYYAPLPPYTPSLIAISPSKNEQYETDTKKQRQIVLSFYKYKFTYLTNKNTIKNI